MVIQSKKTFKIVHHFYNKFGFNYTGCTITSAVIHLLISIFMECGQGLTQHSFMLRRMTRHQVGDREYLLRNSIHKSFSPSPGSYSLSAIFFISTFYRLRPPQFTDHSGLFLSFLPAYLLWYCICFANRFVSDLVAFHKWLIRKVFLASVNKAHHSYSSVIFTTSFRPSSWIYANHDLLNYIV